VTTTISPRANASMAMPTLRIVSFIAFIVL
jgi:hypothetical protein